MLALLGVIVGVVGTLLGQYLLRLMEKGELRRGERIDACTAFVSAAETARAAQFDRWWSKVEQRPTGAHIAAKQESYARRTALKVARSRLRLVGISGSALQKADQILAAVADLHHSTSEEILLADGDVVRQMIDQFSDEASALFT